MLRRTIFLMLIILLPGAHKVVSQVSPAFSMYFLNPYQFNPSYAGLEGRPVFNLVHRQQWVSIEGAPVTTGLTFHMPLKYGVSIGAEVFNDKRSILSTNSINFTLGYAVQFNQKNILRFGLSGGGGSRNIDLNQVDNTSDPAIGDALENSFYLDGNFGISFQSGYFFLGVALPNFFEPNVNNYTSLENGGFAPLNEILFNTSYRFYFALDEMFFEPSILYRYNQNMPSQFEVAGIFNLKNLLWFGGSYRQEYGATAMLGITFNRQFMLGYGYGIGSEKLPGIGANTHEIQLSIALGKRKERAGRSPQFFVSYVDTERFYPDQRVKKQKASEEIAKTKEPVPIIVEVEENTEDPVVEQEGIDPEHDDPRLVLTSPRKESKVSAIRSETVNAGISDFELSRGNYIIIGEYTSQSEAAAATDRLGNEGYRAGYGYVSRKRTWMVYIYRSDSRIGFRKKVLEIRDNPDFRNAWILTVL